MTSVININQTTPTPNQTLTLPVPTNQNNNLCIISNIGSTSFFINNIEVKVNSVVSFIYNNSTWGILTSTPTNNIKLIAGANIDKGKAVFQAVKIK